MKGLEIRLAKAEQAQGDAMRELREAEVAAADQESLLLRAAALEDKLRESRGEQGQLENYKQVSQMVHVLVCTCVKWHLSSACPSAQALTRVSVCVVCHLEPHHHPHCHSNNDVKFEPNTIQVITDLADNVVFVTHVQQ